LLSLQQVPLSPGGSPAFPNSTYNATNYWVDVVFTEP
jgi:hypothetical protein